MNYYDLTNPQKSIWLMDKYYEGTNINNICGTLTIKQDVDLGVLSKALNIFIKNNKSFSLNFKEENGNAVQYFVENQKDLEFEVFHLKDYKEAQKLAKETSEHVFNIYDKQLYKFILYKLENGHGGFVVLTHHIISDAATFSIIGTEVVEIYGKLLAGEEISSKDYSYEDYIKDEKEYMNSTKFEKDEEYWTKLYNDVPEVCSVPSMLSNKSKDLVGKAERKNCLINKDLVNKISDFCKKNKVSNFNFFMAVYAIYLSKITSLNDFVIGTPILNRTNFKEKHTTGMFINTAPLRIKLGDNISFLEFVKQIATSSLSMLRYQKYPYEMLLENLRKKEKNLPTLFDVMLSYQITKANDKELAIPYEVEWFPTSTISNGIAIHLHDNNDEGTLNISYDYQLQKYEEKDILNMHNRILHIISQVLENECLLEKDIEIVTEEEKNQILFEFNDTEIDYPKNKTIIDLFEEQVQKTPNNIAVVLDDKKLTYKELNEKANAVALDLIYYGIQPKDTIGVFLPRSIELIISIFAILKCGAVYMPLYVDFPDDRIDYMLQNSKAKLVLTNDTLKTRISDISTILLNDFREIDNVKHFYKKTGSTNDIIYIIYTSGSTGRPKGVQITNNCLNNFICAFDKYFSNVSVKDNFLSSTNISFDVSIFELFLPLLNGASLVLYHDELIKDILDFCDYIVDKKITGLYIPPNILDDVYSILKDKKDININKLLVGVEGIRKTTLDKYFLLNPDMIIINGYGPTETTICCTALPYSKNLNIDSDIVPIGKPLYNNHIYILGEQKNLQPIGITGELYVTGTGVGAGYINNAEETSKNYLSNIFDSSSKKMYKTGDIGKWNPDGTISLSGRKDNQVKISGHRIELGEINSIVMSYPNIEKSITMVLDLAGKKRLVTYFTSSQKADIQNILEFLSKKLVPYMIPDKLIELEEFPLTSNGKIDKKSLPTPIFESTSEYVKPKNETEKLLLKIFKSVLNLEKIGVTDSFFELGGDSLLAIKLTIYIYEKTKVRISMQKLFENPTVSKLANLIQSHKNIIDNLDKIPKAIKKDYYHLSSGQKRIYYASQIAGSSSTLYNMPGSIIFDKKPNIERLNECFEKLIERHSSLRTYFEIINEEVYQKLSSSIQFKVEELSDSNDSIDDIMKEFVRPFDLSKAPLFRASIIKQNDKYLLLFDMHHIICDGTSLSIFMQELSKLYSEKVPAKISKEEEHKILYEFNNTKIDYPKDKTVIDYFEEQVKKTPTKTALVFEDQSFSYEELNHKANQLGHYLIKNNVKAKDIIAIMVNRSPEMIISILAVLKIGATYLPIDPEYPTDRINYMLDDSHSKTILVHNATSSLDIGTSARAINVDLSLDFWENFSYENIGYSIPLDSLIYIIYTSGSTGKPKGVMISHKNIVNLLLGVEQYIDFSPEKSIVSVTTFCFDIFAIDIWGPLTNGMKLILANDMEKLSPLPLKELCEKHKASIIQTTPSRFSFLMAITENTDFWTQFSDIIVTGEAFPKILLEKLQKHTNSNIFNMYGPTETTVWSTAKNVTNESDITIGKPIANTTCYILDENKNLLPIGFPGNLYIGGDGVSLGYLNREDLTKEKFIPSPFRKGEVIYDTGDLAYIDENYDIVHLGRSDFQVKIRGYRIELGEIEYKLLSFPNITNCAVNAVDNATKLCAYYISNGKINESDLRHYLRNALPSYMVPNYFVKMEEFPYTPNGKIDKKALPLPNKATIHEEELEQNDVQNLPIDYVDYAEWEFEELKSHKLKTDKDFWINEFKDRTPVLDFPTDYARPNFQSFEGSKIYKVIDLDLAKKVNNLAKKLDVSSFMLLLSIYYVLLFKYTNNEDIVVGSPIVGRNKEELLNIVGMFVNTLPLKNHIENNMSFKDFLNTVKANCVKAFDHQVYPYDQLVSDLNIKKDTSRNPLFDTVFTYQNNGITPIDFIGFETELYTTDTKISKFDLSLEVTPKENEGFNLVFEYCTKLFKKETIERFACHFINIIKDLINNCDKKISDIEVISEEERNRILYEFNDTRTDYPKDKTIIDLFEEQVNKNPNNTVIVFDNKKLTYKELNEKANALACYLKNQNVQNGDIVCMLFDKSLEMIVAIVSILKLGACYLPIDINYPKDRIDYIIDNSKSKIALTTKNIASKLSADIPLICVDLDFSNIYDVQTSYSNLKSTSPEDIAYIMYTSGSTGRPKGVMVKNINVIRLVKNTNFIKFSSHERFLQTGSIVFDACTFEIWGALLNGHELYIIKKDDLLDTSLFEKYLLENKITILWLTAPLFNQLCESNSSMFSSVKYLLTGGDVLSPKHINIVRKSNPNLTIINGYGPTENTTFSTCFTIDKNYENNIPIGKPIANSTAYIVSSSGSLLPIGLAGELWVGGDGVSKGYFNNTELTNEKFIKNPFGNGMIYKTGDLAKWLPDGNISFIGRIDNQVKIRGFRVELNEINNILSNFDNIKECTTVILEIQSEKSICSYFSSIDGSSIDKGIIKEYLKEYLPTYMIPSYLCQLDKLPINANGKIDKNALPINIELKTNDEIVLPTNKLESDILDIYKQVLHIEEIGIRHNFFEIGGDSLTAMKVHVECTHKNINIAYSDIFKFPTVEKLASNVRASKTESTIIEKCNIRSFYPTSSAQKRMYLASIMDENSTLYNVSGGVLLDFVPNIEKLQNALENVISRHDILRTYFEIVNGKIVQKIHDSLDIKIDIQDVNTNNPEELFFIYESTFNLSKTPLFNVVLFRLPNEKALLMLDIHHSIFDGTSLNNFIQELSDYYNDKPLPELDISYKDFAVWENNKLASNGFKDSKKFWQEQFSGNIPTLNLPTVFPRPKIKSYNGTVYTTSLSKDFTKKINDFANNHLVTPYMVMLSAYYILLNKYTECEDIIVGTPSFGRLYKELEPLLGMFVNTLPLRNSIYSNIEFEELLQNIKNNCINAFAHQDYPFDELVKSLKLPKDASRSPLFDTMFVYQNDGFAKANFGGIRAEYISYRGNRSKFDISLDVLPIDGELKLSFEYSSQLFDEIFIGNFAKSYENILNVILDHPEILIGDISIMSKDSENKVLYKFNKIDLDNNVDTNLFSTQIENPNFSFEGNVDKAQDFSNEQSDSLGQAIPSNVFSDFTNENSYDKIPVEIYNANYVAPRNNLEIQVANAFQDLLSVPNIGIDDNFFELGGDSLTAINLQIELLKSNLKITYADIFSSPTVRTLSERIGAKKDYNPSLEVSNNYKEFDKILENTTRLPDTINFREIGNVIITGTTGFLGAHILENFLINEKGKAYCLVRESKSLSAVDRLKEKLHYYFGKQYDKYLGNRIITISSDISKDNLGITSNELEETFADVSCIINSAAKVSHYGNYSDFEKVNVNGTENLLKLCLKFNKRFYQISTLSVSGNGVAEQSFENDVIFNESNFYINQSLNNVYARSKFEAEKLVLSYILKGVDAYILRIGNLMNRYRDR